VKSIIIIGDGMSDLPVARLGGRTPLMVAQKPWIDRIAREGRMGRLRTIGETGPADSAVANLAVLGYDASASSQGRAVLEAASMGVEIADGDVALRCNLACVEGPTEDRRIRNHSAGHITTPEATELLQALDAELGGERGPTPVRFHPGVSYRHLMVLPGGWASSAVECAPPHDHVGERVADLLPRTRELTGEDPAKATATAERLVDLYRRAVPILESHPVNRARRAAGKDEANVIWTWSPGRRPSIRTLHELYGVHGAVISAVDLVMGLGVYAGMDLIRVPGATGLHDTNYEGKAEAGLDALADHDLVYVHVEATDEAAHARDLDLKIKCIEYLDQRLVRPILEGLESRGIEATVAILPDHPTPVESGQHGRDPVPVAIRRPGEAPDGTERYDEEQAARGSLGLLVGSEFIRRVVGQGRG
jgi:2,3-bisphosphoglycerate-independent phosphoglycerate mutase